MKYFEICRFFLNFYSRNTYGFCRYCSGVSGGTIALITGIYERLVHSISTINFTFIKPLLKGDLKGFKERLFYEIDFKFFIPLLCGIGLAMLTLANVISYCMDVYTALTYSFFLGLIIASSYVLYRQMDELTLKHVIFTVIGAVLAYIFCKFKSDSYESYFADTVHVRFDSYLCNDFAGYFRIILLLLFC